MCCRIMIGNLQVRHTFIVCKNLQKELVIGLAMQQLYWLGCDWTSRSHMYLHQDENVLINSMDIVRSVTHLKTIGNVHIPAYAFVTIPAKRTEKCTTNTPCIFDIEINEIIGVQTPS